VRVGAKTQGFLGALKAWIPAGKPSNLGDSSPDSLR